MRICDICGVIDDGPRHLITHAPGEVPIDTAMVDRVANLHGYRGYHLDVLDAALDVLQDTTLQIRHPSCCAASGCDVCTQEEN